MDGDDEGAGPLPSSQPLLPPSPAVPGLPPPHFPIRGDHDTIQVMLFLPAVTSLRNQEQNLQAVVSSSTSTTRELVQRADSPVPPQSNGNQKPWRWAGGASGF